MSVDPQQIRVLLRLVHSLQLERGSSCAYAAQNQQTTTSGEAKQPRVSSVFEHAMNHARIATDMAVRSFRRRVNNQPDEDQVPVESSLRKIRSLIYNHSTNAEAADTSQNDDLTFHRILVCFNTLISCIIYQCVMQRLLDPIISENSNDNINNQLTKSTIKNRHRRGLSSDINDKLTAMSPEKILGTGTPTSTPTPKQRNIVRKTFPVGLNIGLDNNGDESGNDKGHKSLLPRPAGVASAVPPPPPPVDPAVSSSDPMNERVRKLLELLHIFVQLKESAGVERAILSSLLAFRFDTDQSLPSVGMLISDLVLQVENQRSLVHQLERLPKGNHHELVLDLAHLSPRLMDLQQIILTDFSSLHELEYDAETIWDMITLYIDKLHSVELLILEDLESLLPMTGDDIPSSTGAVDPSDTPVQTLGAVDSGKGTTATINAALSVIATSCTDVDASKHIVSDIESIPADEIKRRILELVRSGGQNSVENSMSKIQLHSEGTLKSISESGSISMSSGKHRSSGLVEEDDTHKSSERSAIKKLQRIPSKEWEISIYEIKFTKRLGQGASATTYLGQWTGQNVAIKVASITEFGQDGWRTEVNCLQRLHHPNIIRMMGTIYNDNPQTQCLVLEYCNAGDLATALRYPTPKNFFFHVSLSIANAMTYLHSRQIIHRDLKPGNILCDGNVASGQFTVKVTDFGIAASFEDDDDETEQANKARGYTPLDLTGETGTYRWMSPECIRHESYSYRTDVYSFAVMMWQFLTREEPFNDVSAVEAAEMSALQEKRPPMPALVPQLVKQIIETNWKDDANERWDFSRIVDELQSMRSSLSAEDLSYVEEPHGHPIQLLDGLFEGGNDETGKRVTDDGGTESGRGPSPTGSGRRESKRSIGKREKSWKSRNSRSPTRKSSPGRRPSLLSSFFGQRRKGSIEQHRGSKYRSKAIAERRNELD